MEKKNNGLVIILMGIIIVILIALCILFATNTITFNHKEIKNEIENQKNTNELNNEESFSAIDLCIFNFFSNTMDFIKLGTPKSYIKKKVGLDTIDSSGLPIGILEEIRPHITKKYVADFDIVILLSDGVADAFGSDNLENYINNLNMINPQDIANAIITKARVLSNNVCEDDMTVLVARIFPTK